MHQLTPHFSLAELTRTDQQLDNQPDAAELVTLCETARQLETVRTILENAPIVVHSAFRSAAVNAAVGGVDNSAHRLGYAVDFECPEYGDTYHIAIALVHSGAVTFDQIINEHSWVHIAFGPSHRGQVMTLVAGSSPNAYQWGIHP